MKLDGKVAVVTGAGSGIGRATAELMAREGAKVVVAEYRQAAGEAAVESIRSRGGDATFVQVDVAKAAQVEQMVGQAIDAYGRIDILFNNAGVFILGTVSDTEEDVWDKIMDVNLKGTYLCSKHVIPHMIRGGGGAIINASSSTGAHDAAANFAAYIASKGGVAMLTKAMAIDCAPYQIRVNAVAPGPTDTPMVRDVMDEKELAEFAASFPAKRFGQPEEIAQAVLFLASDEASFVTGLVMAVDGGQTAQV